MRAVAPWAILLLLSDSGCSRAERSGAGGSPGKSDSPQKDSGVPQAVGGLGACDRVATGPICPTHAHCPGTWEKFDENAGWCAHGNWLSRLAGESYECSGIHLVVLRGIDDGHLFFYGDGGRLIARVSRGLGRTSCFGTVPEVMEKECVPLSSWSCLPPGISRPSIE